VSKLIELHDPESYKVNVNQYKRRAPKYETRYRKTREVKVFEMTHDEKCYGNYTVIKGFSANSQAELAAVIDNYLDDLMKTINEPLVDCPHCKGMGVIIKELE
jgi:excinuclease UvrABC ATPase subunit